MSAAGLAIRPARAGDAAGLAQIYAPIVRDTPISFELDPPDAEEMWRRVGHITRRLPWLVCSDGPELLGYAYAARHRERAAYRWSVDVSVYVHERARRRSVGTALYEALLAILTLQGFHRAYAGITLPNPASVGLHEQLGFRHLGVYHRVGFKSGTWHDVGWWDRELTEPTEPPAEPVPFPRLEGSPEVARACASALTLLRDASG